MLVAGTFLLGLFLAGSAQAVDVNVSNYSWLQNPSSDVTPFVNSANGTVGNGFGQIEDFRWGDYVWLPSNTMTNSGGQMYYAGMQFDQPRTIDSVRVQWWLSAGITASQYHIDGSNDGSAWTNIGNGGAVTTGQRVVTNLPVTPGSYEYVRVRLENGEYTNGGGYGGPGFHLIDPIGSGSLSTTQVNWANGAEFGTTIVNTNMPTYNSTTYNDGSLQEGKSTAVWTGTSGSSWPSGSYTTIDLQENRLISNTVAVWSEEYFGNDYDVEYSIDGTNFFSVNSPVTTQQSPTGSYIGATEMDFEPEVARYIRLSNASRAGAGFVLMNQLLLHSPADGVLDSNPGENGTISIIGLVDGQTETLSDAIELSNIGSSESGIGILSYEITGVDAALFDLANFVPTALGSGESTTFDLLYARQDGGLHSALLTFNTTLGDYSFNLESSSVPEPSSSLMLLLGCGVFGLIRRKHRANA